MGWFRKRRSTTEDDPTAPAQQRPVEIDLGFLQHPWEAEMLVQRLAGDGLRVHLTTQSQIPEMAGGLGPKRCLLLVGAEHEGQVRAELTAVGLL